MGIIIKWDITYQCNLMCEHCLNGEYLNNSQNELTYNDFIAIIENILKYTSIERIHFLGGEPLVHKDFYNMVLFLNKKKIHFGFNTNGLLLSEETINHFCTLPMLDNIIMSLEGPDEETNDAIRGKSVYKIIIKRLEALKKFKQIHRDILFKTSINCVATTLNYLLIDKLIDLCITYQVDQINILEFIESGNGVGKGLALSPPQNLSLLREIAYKIEKVKDKININPKFAYPLSKKYLEECENIPFPSVNIGCGAGANFMFIDNQGNIFPCDRDREIPHSLIQKDFLDIIKSPEFITPFSRYYGEIYNNLFPCNSCEYLQKSCFPCHIFLNEDEKAIHTTCSYLVESAKLKGVDILDSH